MEPNSSAFDIQPASQPRVTHTSRTVVIVMSIILVVLGVALIALRIKEKRAYEAYLATPDGQLNALSVSSAPITDTPEQQLSDLEALQKSSKPVNASKDTRLQALQQ